MFGRYFLSLALWVLSFALASAQTTPIEKLIIKYEDVKGSRELMLSGAKITFARGLIRQTQVGSLADDVDKLAVLKMGNASQQEKASFYNDLVAVLKSYQYCGKHPSKNGPVDVYISVPSGEIVKELVIYNPAIYTLNSLYGEFTVDSHLKLTGGN